MNKLDHKLKFGGRAKIGAIILEKGLFGQFLFLEILAFLKIFDHSPRCGARRKNWETRAQNFSYIAVNRHFALGLTAFHAIRQCSGQ